MKPQPMITVTSVPDSAAFHCAPLDARRGHGGEHYHQLLIGNEIIMQLHGIDSDENHAPLRDVSSPTGNGVVLWFETADFDALLTRIREHDIALDREPFENDLARQMEYWLHDPDGYQVVVAGPSTHARKPIGSGDDSG